MSGAGTFTVPAGASTGSHEAVESRDGGTRYGGRGVRRAVEAVRDEIAPVLQGRDVTAQRELDELLVEVDGTEDLSRLGANAVLGASGAVAHAASDALGEPLYTYLAPDEPGRLPLPFVNILSGGRHAHGGIEIQDVLAVPVGAASFSRAVESVWNVRAAVRERIVAAGHRPLLADEGGFAPPLSGIDAAFDLLEAGIREAGFEPGAEIAIAVDVAATQFYDPGTDTYELPSVDRALEGEAMIDLVAGWVDERPVVAVEDPLAEDDWERWRTLLDRIGSTVHVIGDDLIVTDGERLHTATASGAANAVLVKPNQAGSLTRTIDVIEAAKEAGVRTVISARSGETSDTTIADLAVALDAGAIKIGSLGRSERLAKYNRLLEIEREYDGGLAQDVVPFDTGDGQPAGGD